MKIHRAYYTMFLCLCFNAWAAEFEDSTQILPFIAESMPLSEWKNFARIGCGYYPIPEHLKSLLPKTLQLAQSLNSSYEGKPGYSAEKKQQIETLFLEQKDWSNYPEETAQLAKHMAEIGQSIVRNVLKALEVDPALHETLTGGLSCGYGKNFFKVARYDAAKNLPGFLWHKDIRFVTVLFINQEGLQGRIHNAIFDIKPLDGYFIINLGAFFEALFNDKTKLSALVHQVQQVTKNRVSFGAFCEGDFPNKGFYQLHDGDVTWMQPGDIQAFLIEDKDKAFATSAHTIFSEKH